MVAWDFILCASWQDVCRCFGGYLGLVVVTTRRCDGYLATWPSWQYWNARKRASVALLHHLRGAGKEVHHARGHERVVDDIALAAIAHNAVRPQDGEVFGDRRGIGADNFRQLSNRTFTAREALDDHQSRFIG